jgi:hypothetical protein
MSDEMHYKTFEELYYETQVTLLARNREIQKLKADRDVTVEALKLIAMDNIYVAENGWRDEYFLNVKQATEALKSIGEQGGEG